MAVKKVFSLLAALALAWPLAGRGAWSDATAGQPWVQSLVAKDFFTSSGNYVIAQDRLGRLLAGGDRFEVFDGQGWRVYPVGNAQYVTAIAPGPGDRVWVGATNEIGYMDEPSPGNFVYHSLTGLLPESERSFGLVWGCAMVDNDVYFITRDHVIRWDGEHIRTWNFPTAGRLFFVQSGDEVWFHHVESGLYQLTREGPVQRFPATALPPSGVIGLLHVGNSLVTVSGRGFHRIGPTPEPLFSAALNNYLQENRVSCVRPLDDGGYVLGTVNGGLVVASATGELLRVFRTTEGLPADSIFFLLPAPDHQLWVASSAGLHRIEIGGHVTVLHRPGETRSGSAEIVRATRAGVVTATAEGVFRVIPGTPPGVAQLEKIPALGSGYIAMHPWKEGALLVRLGGLDYFDGERLQKGASAPALNLSLVGSDPRNPDAIYAVTDRFLASVDTSPEGHLALRPLAELTDPCSSLATDALGRVWLGTASRGVVRFDAARGEITAVNNPAQRQPFGGPALVARWGDRLFISVEQRAYLVSESQPDQLVPIPTFPAAQVLGSVVVADGRLVLLYNREAVGGARPSQGLGALTFRDGAVRLEEYEVPFLGQESFAHSLATTREGDRDVLWIGGHRGPVRVDLDHLRRLAAPDTPLIRMDLQLSGAPHGAGTNTFAFDDSRMSFRIFPGEPVRSDGWLLEQRLVRRNGPWSAPSNRRAYEFTNLSEGDYRFEVRAVNAAGQRSEPTVFSFRVLPPWYRSPAAFAGYALALGLAVWGLVHFRERRIRAQNERLEMLVHRRTAELVKANAAKDEFLASVSHEIRNPMNGVIGIADALQTAALDPASRRKFGMLRQCAGHLSSLLEDILDFSKMQAGVIELDDKPFDLVELLDGVTAMTAADSEQHRIPVEVAVSPAVPRHLRGDPRRLRQILLNFISNALKFAGRGQVSVTVWCKAQPRPDLVEVIFAVSDDGPGIAPEEQQRLFQRFERGSAARATNAPGTGLGLALCKGLVEKMGGRIWVESEPGQGASFHFSAPLRIESAGTAPHPAIATAGPAPTETALVVDDQEYNRIVLADLLATLGYRVHVAGDAAHALALAAAHNCALVFLDYDLPETSGLEIARQIRRLENATRAARIFATTAFSTPEKQAECLAAGMNAFLGKPITLERLQRVLHPAPTASGSAPPPAPADPFDNLRLLARKKGVAFAEELKLYVSELQVEIERLDEAIARRDTREAAHYAHLLCGRFSFVREEPPERVARRLHEAAARADWVQVGVLAPQLRALVDELRVRTAAGVPAAPPA